MSLAALHKFSARAFCFTVFMLLFAAGVQTAHADSWQQPTQQELTMTSLPQVPGAAAVYLYREDATDDSLHIRSYYVRLKVLTEAGREYANVKVEGGSFTSKDNSSYDVDVADVEGRTIHPDGTVIPFTGKPYKQTVEKSAGEKFTETIFTLPDVEVGSILEYRYKVRINDDMYSAPEWLVQQDLFVCKGYFSWKATDDVLLDELRQTPTLGVAWSQTLPPGAAMTNTPMIDLQRSGHTIHHFELTVQNVPPAPDEEYMPPTRSFTYRVNFYYAVDRSQDDYWKNEGKAWAKQREHFIGSPGSLQDILNTLVAPGDSDTVKLQKIYAAMMTLDNTSFSREHESAEDRAEGLKDVKTVLDIWQRKRGNNDQITLLFIGLARAAGMKAYDMRVTNRDESIFSPALLSLNQLDDDMAIVVLDGKEQFFDPGQRDCPFGQLAWIHTDVNGLREMSGGATAIATTPVPPYTQSQTQRIADLTLNADGTAQGMITITWMGAPALDWRQQALRDDEDEAKRSMKDWLQGLIPAGLDAEIESLENLDDYEKPLIANFTVHGPLAVMTTMRLILPGEFFEANSKPLFSAPTRDIAVYFPYAGRTADAVRVKFPPEWKVESAPKVDTTVLPNLAAYQVKQIILPASVQINRTYELGTFFFLPAEYPDVRTYYNKLAADDQQPIVLITADAASPQPVGPSAQ